MTVPIRPDPPPFRDPVGLEPDVTVSVDTTGDRSHTANEHDTLAIEHVANRLDALPAEVVRVVRDGDGGFVVIDWQTIARAAIEAMDDARAASERRMTMSAPDFYGDTDGMTHHDEAAEAAARAQDATLRDRIAERIFNAVEISGGTDCVVGIHSYDATDDILAMIREAMLTQNAVGHAIVAYQTAVHTSPMAAAITASLDAALGGDDA